MKQKTIVQLNREEEEERLDLLTYYKACGVAPSSKPIFQMEEEYVQN